MKFDTKVVISVFMASRVTDAYTVSRTKPESARITNRTTNGVVIIRDASLYRYTTAASDAVSDRTHVIFLPEAASYELFCHVPGDCGLINFTGSVPSNVPFSLETSRSDELFSLYERIVREPSDYARLSSLYAIFDILDAEHRQNRLPAVLQKAKAIMEASFADSRLSLADVSHAANISEIYLRRLFAENIGCSPHAYLAKLRMEKAKNLLRREDVTVEEVASDCGYTSVYYFSAAFKKAVGMPPTVFRQRERNL